MFTLNVHGIEIRCDSAADAAALIAALGDLGAARLLPPAATGPKEDTRPHRSPRATPAPKRVPGIRIGRKPTWTDEEVAQLHARLKKGERIEDLAAERGKPAAALYQLFRRKGLAVKFARPTAAPPPPVRRLAPGESGVEDEKGSYRKAG